MGQSIGKVEDGDTLLFLEHFIGLTKISEAAKFLKR